MTDPARTRLMTPDGIVCLSPDPWGDVKRPQQLMTRLAERTPVIYVEPPASFASLGRHPVRELSDGRTRWSRATSGRADELAPGVHVVTPLSTVPPHHRAVLRSRRLQTAEERLSRRSLERRVREAVERIGLRTPALWVSEPADLNGLTAVADLLVYDCVDRWTDFPGPVADGSWKARVIRDEKRLLSSADVVFCSAEGLFDANSASVRGRLALLRNAADVEHFAPAGRPMPPEIASLSRPVVGYIGAVAEWVDLVLVRELARMRPDWSFVLVGPVFSGAISGDAGGLAHLDGAPNVHVIGARRYHEVPAYLEAFDVAIIPFKVNGLTEATNPIKLYEYLAAGKPVVSTPLPEAAAVDTVIVAGDAEGFAAAIETALADAGPAQTARRREVAARNSWDARADEAWAVMTGAGLAVPFEIGSVSAEELVQTVGTHDGYADVQLLPAPRQVHVGRWAT